MDEVPDQAFGRVARSTLGDAAGSAMKKRAPLSAFDQGFRAFVDGVDSDACPTSLGATERRIWILGWESARRMTTRRQELVRAEIEAFEMYRGE